MYMQQCKSTCTYQQPYSSNLVFVYVYTCTGSYGITVYMTNDSYRYAVQVLSNTGNTTRVQSCACSHVQCKYRYPLVKLLPSNTVGSYCCEVSRNSTSTPILYTCIYIFYKTVYDHTCIAMHTRTVVYRYVQLHTQVLNLARVGSCTKFSSFIDTCIAVHT